MSQAIGGMIGKYFRVKGYCNQPIPDESGKPNAGGSRL